MIPMDSHAEVAVITFPRTIMVTIKNTSMDTMAVMPAYCLLLDVNCLRARLAESARLVMGSLPLLSNQISFLPPAMARTGEIFAILPVIMTMHRIEKANIPAITTTYISKDSFPSGRIPVMGEKIYSAIRFNGIAGKIPASTPAAWASRYCTIKMIRILPWEKPWDFMTPNVVYSISIPEEMLWHIITTTTTTNSRTNIIRIEQIISGNRYV